MKHGEFTNTSGIFPPEMSCSKNASGSWRQMVIRNRKGNYNRGPEWDVPSTDRGNGWYQKWLEKDSLKDNTEVWSCQNKNRPHATNPQTQKPTGPNLQTVQRCPRITHTDRHSQVAGIVYRNICAVYGEVPNFQYETPLKMVENNRVKVLWTDNNS